MDLGLSGRTVLVTGGAGAIGSAIVRGLAEEGARPILHFFHSEAAADLLAAEVGALHLRADLRVEAEVEALFGAAREVEARLDGLVVNAGSWLETPIPVHEMTIGQWRDTIDSNLTSAFLTCREFLRHVKETPREEATIVVIASTAALFGEAHHADYAAAKAGLAYGLTLSLKNEIAEVAPRGRVNCVCPGWTASPMVQATLDAATLARVTATMPLEKIATPDDVARAVLFLLSERAAGHVTGAILPVAGGMEGRVLRRG